jgi:hypothetical protein
MYDFIERFAPHHTQARVDEAVACVTRVEREALFADLELPPR